MITNASANVIGGIVQRQSDELLGYEQPTDEGTELANVAFDGITGGVWSFFGGKVADKLRPIPNLRRQELVLSSANRRSTRPVRIEAARSNARMQAGANAVIGGIAGGALAELTKRLWIWVTATVSGLQDRRQRTLVTSRVCADENCGHQ